MQCYSIGAHKRLFHFKIMKFREKKIWGNFCPPGSGSRDPTESGFNLYPDPKHWLKYHQLVRFYGAVFEDDKRT